MVDHAVIYYREEFQGFWGLTQGVPFSPTIFNVVVGALVCHWVYLVEVGAGGQYGGGEVLHSAAFFYADDDVFAFTGPDWMHMSFDTLTSLLYRVGLCTNSRKTVGMLFCP